MQYSKVEKTRQSCSTPKKMQCLQIHEGGRTRRAGVAWDCGYDGHLWSPLMIRGI